MLNLVGPSQFAHNHDTLFRSFLKKKTLQLLTAFLHDSELAAALGLLYHFDLELRTGLGEQCSQL
jgi:hypothetical protein